MEKIDQKLDQWIYNSKIRAEVRKIIEDYVFDEKTEAFKAGWIKCDQHQSEPFINFAKEVIEYYEQHDIGDEDIYNKAKKLINGREIIIEEIDFGRTHLAQDKDITDNIMIDVEQYANQRVIEELEKLKDNYIDLWELTDDLDKRIKELKQ